MYFALALERQRTIYQAGLDQLRVTFIPSPPWKVIGSTPIRGSRKHRSTLVLIYFMFNFQCSKIRGRRCSEDSECACLNRHNATLICNYNYTCEKRTFIDDIMRRQPVSYNIENALTTTCFLK